MRNSHIKMFVVDVDGVLTDGKIWYLDNGIRMRGFNTRDGIFGLLNAAGVITVFCSGENDSCVRLRGEKLKLQYQLLGSSDKVKDVGALLRDLGLSFQQLAYVGDDLADIPLLKLAKMSFAPHDAVTAVKLAVQHVTQARGGDGVVREIFDNYFRE